MVVGAAVRSWSVRAEGDRGVGLSWRDWVVAVLAAAAAVVQVSVGPSADEPASWVASVAVLFGVLGGLALAWRRRRPFVATAVAITGSGLQVLIAGPSVPVVGWLAVAAAARHVPDLRHALRGAAVAALAVAGVNAVAGVLHDSTGGVPLVFSLTLVVLLGASLVRLQGARVDAQRRERDAARQRAVAVERLRIARDLHDLVGHGLSTVAIQSSAARLALDSGDAAAARRAVGSVEQASRGALEEMRQLLGVLRHGADDAAPPSGLDGVEALADGARAAGHVVTVHRSGPLESAPPAAALCAYRVVQEAVTNAVRHAPGATISVSLCMAEQDLTVEVTDDGGDRPAGAGPGDGGARYGLVGLRERVGAAGGTVEVGPRRDHAGWRVAVWLPLREDR